MDTWKYHPFNKDRDFIQYSTPTLVRFIRPHRRKTRVIIKGGQFDTGKHATIDITDNPEQVSDWEQWCSQSSFSFKRVDDGVEVIKEYLVDPDAHPHWRPE